MDLYEVEITDHAIGQLERFIDYIQFVLLDEQAAEAVSADAVETQNRLRFLAGVLSPCKNDILRSLGYYPMRFKSHKYVMLYRIVDKTAIVEAIYHQTQDYESAFLNELWN